MLDWNFLITLGLVMVAILLVAVENKKASPSNSSMRWTEIDILGGIVFGVFCGLLVSFSNTVGKQGALGLSGISLLLGKIIIGLILAWSETRYREPIIKLAFSRPKYCACPL